MSVDIAPIVQVVENEYYDFGVPQTEVISVDKFPDICRTCLGKEDITSIFSVSYDQISVPELLLICASIQVQQGDYLPQNICSVCLGELIRSFSFKQKCQQSDTFLKNIHQKEFGDTKSKSENSLRLIRNHEVYNEYKSEEIKSDNRDATLEDATHETSKKVCLQTNNDSVGVLQSTTLPENGSYHQHIEHNDLQADDENKYSDDAANDSEASYFSDMKPKRVTRKKVKMKQERQVLRRGRRMKLKGPPFKCRDCPESYETRDDLREHRKSAKHPEARNHTCSFCQKKFTSSKLRQHMRVHTKEKPFMCKICSQGFSMSGNLKRHMMTHTGERPHVCEVCGKGFIQATTLQIHRRTHANNERRISDGSDTNGGPNFICDYCGRGFKRLARYNAHLKKHFNESNDSRKLTQDDDIKEYICDTCKRAYKTKHLLKAHQLTHGEKTFLCSECGKGFVTKAALLSHLKVHTGERPHTCTVCKKSFAHVGSFEAHMLIHTGQKPYNCNVCTKAFTQLSHLKYHLRTHSGERPYICTYCAKTFALKGNLTVHMRIHTGETPYLCPVCGKGFYDSSSMKKHRRGHGDVIISVPGIEGNAIMQTDTSLIISGN